MIRIAIVEDDMDEQGHFRECLTRYQAEHGVVFQLHFFQNGITFLSETAVSFDVIFMDIEMPYMNGMDVAAKLREYDTNACLIFVTNMAQYAIKGYEVNALDFLVKPVAYPIFAFKISKALAIAEKRKTTELVLKRKTGLVRVQISDIYYVEVSSHRVFYYTATGMLEDWASLAQVEKQLKAYGFSRCNASCLINMTYVEKIVDNLVYVRGEPLELSRGKKKQFIADLTQFLEGN